MVQVSKLDTPTLRHARYAFEFDGKCNGSFGKRMGVPNVVHDDGRNALFELRQEYSGAGYSGHVVAAQVVDQVNGRRCTVDVASMKCLDAPVPSHHQEKYCGSENEGYPQSSATA